MQRLKADGSVVGAPLEVAFNPTEFTLNKTAQLAEIAVPGLDSTMLQYVRGEAETLTLDLFFDSTDEGGAGADAAPVTRKTDPFYDLVRIDPATRALPVVLFAWGADSFPGGRSYSTLGAGRHGFKGVVESVRQRFTMFSSLGKPLRATISLTLKEYKTLSEMVAEQAVAGDERAQAHTVSEGETITDIAEQQGGDGSDWRDIAENNGVDDPEAIQPGEVIEMEPMHITGTAP
ncbi:LysM peptidoglycan-binding domain-containing protein [Roseovarius spongiae]|uniref:LysM peptidoglycan-binding domain-containing protein n=2 Tax=Roseovarius spongiae TaxID=2320272 RepID=A0A3A8BA59_9RHOB|nr:LysM peptidoglycan-binding domain-containing protein [Roseovarius spongiae]